VLSVYTIRLKIKTNPKIFYAGFEALTLVAVRNSTFWDRCHVVCCKSTNVLKERFAFINPVRNRHEADSNLENETGMKRSVT
jgi:hypothetical protein